MFTYAKLFNQDISSWDVGNVVNMSDMFYQDINDPSPNGFNQDLSSWSVAGVTNCVRFSLNAFQYTSAKPSFTNCTP
jgi:surface protein